MANYSKFEILEKVIKSAHDKSITLRDIEKFLKKIKANTDANGNYLPVIEKASVDHFRLLKGKTRAQKGQIKAVTGLNEALEEQNTILKKQLKSSNLKIETKVNSIYDLLLNLPDQLEEKIQWSKIPDYENKKQQIKTNRSKKEAKGSNELSDADVRRFLNSAPTDDND